MMKKGDVLICLFLILAGIAMLFAFSGAKPGEWVEIHTNGTLYGRYSLNENKILDLKTEHGSNKIVIEKGKVWVSESSCRDKLEIKAGKIQKDGESLICLPNRLVVSIVGKGDVAGVSY